MNIYFNLKLDGFRRVKKKVGNQPRCEGFGRSDTLIGVEASSYESEGEAAKRKKKQSIILNELDAKKRGGRRHEIPTQMT